MKDVIDIKDFLYRNMVLVLVGIMCLGMLCACGKPKIDFYEVAEEADIQINDDGTYVRIGRDGSYLKIDTNPDDKDPDDFGTLDYLALDVCDRHIQNVNEALDLPDYLYDDIIHTTASQGRQEEEFEDIGVVVTWSYSPRNGLEVTYKTL